MGNSCAHGTWIVLKNNTPNALTTTVSNFKFEEWGDWADRVDHKCDKRTIKANETMEEFLRIARGVKSNKWTLSLAFADDTKLVLRIDQRYVNMQVKHWQWIEGLNHPPLVEGGDEALYKIDYEIDWDMWRIIIVVSKKTEGEIEKEAEAERQRVIKAKEEAEKKDIQIDYFAESEQAVAARWKKSAKETIIMRSRERAKRKAEEKAKMKLIEEEKRQSRAQANKKVKEIGSNWKDVNDLAYFLRGYPLLNYFAFLLVMYLFYFIMLFYFSIYLNVSYNSTEA